MSDTPKKSNAVEPTTAVVQAWRRLFSAGTVTVTAEQELHLHDGQLDVVGSVWPAEDQAGRFDLHLTATERGGKRLRLDRMTLHATGRDESGMVLRVAERTARGDLAIRDLREGLTYTLRSPAVAGHSQQPVVLPVRPEAWAGEPWAAESAARPAEKPWELPTYQSSDGRVEATVRPLGGAKAAISFETRAAELAGATVWFALVDEGGLVAHDGEVRLSGEEGGVREWRWTGRVELRSACKLVFEVEERGGEA